MSAKKFQINDTVRIKTGSQKETTGKIYGEFKQGNKLKYVVVGEDNKIIGPYYSYELDKVEKQVCNTKTNIHYVQPTENFEQYQLELNINNNKNHSSKVDVDYNNFGQIIKEILDNNLFGKFVLDDGEIMCVSNQSVKISNIGTYVVNGMYIAYNGYIPLKNKFVVKWIPSEDHMEKLEKKDFMLSLEEAKEMYKAGGKFKEIALRAYSEKNLNDNVYPKSWEDYCETFSGNLFYLDCDGKIGNIFCNGEINENTKNYTPDKEKLIQVIAYLQLVSIYYVWKKMMNWEPSYEKGFFYLSSDYVDRCASIVNLYPTSSCISVMHAFTFPSKKLAEEFRSNFKEYLKLACGLY